MDHWKILVWKEWEEHKWKLLALIVVLLSVFFSFFFQDTKDSESALLGALLGYAAFAPVFVAMSVVSGDHSLRSIDFVRAHPVNLRHVAAVRWIAGACVLVVPLFVCLMCSLVMLLIWPGMPITAIKPFGLASSETTSVALVEYIGCFAGACLNLYAFIVVTALNQRNEFRAGLIGVLTTAVLVVGGGAGLSGWDNKSGEMSVSLVYLGVLISSPIGFAGFFDFMRHAKPELVFVTLFWQAWLIRRLAAVMIRYYGGGEWLAGRLQQFQLRNEHSPRALGRPMVSPWWALFWMQARQSLPVGLVGLAVVGVTLLFLEPGVDPVEYHAVLGSILALIIGVGSFVHELEPKLHTFWRSRPISASSWFWLKFAAGFFVLVVMYDLPYVIAAWLEWVYRYGDGIPLVVTLFPMLLHLMVYSVAVLAACAIRHSVYSTVLAMCFILAILLPPYAYWTHFPDWLSFIELWNSALHTPLDAPDRMRVLVLLVASGLVAAIALPATLLSAALIKRNFSMNA